MSQDEERELKPLEAQLAALRPRSDRLDRDRLMYLAGREAALSEGRRSGGEGDRPIFAETKIGTGPLQRLAGRAARWAWPSMAAAMTAVSAVLAVMLLTRPNVPQIVTLPAAPGSNRIAQATVETPAPGLVAASQDSVFPGLARYRRLSDIFLGPPPQAVEVASLEPYPRLRNQVLQQGLDSWRDPPRRGHDAARSDGAASYRELIDTMLDGPSSKPSPRLLPVMPLSLGAHS